MFSGFHNRLLLAASAARSAAPVQRLQATLARRAPEVYGVLRGAWRRNRVLFDVNGDGARLNNRALLSYVPDAFLLDEGAPQYLNHSNHWECREIARVLGALGYVIDVCDCLDTRFEPRHRYDLIFDAGFNLDRLSTRVGPDCLKIAYATGRHWLTQNAAEYERLRHLHQRRGVALQPRRTAQVSFGAEVCDTLLYVGDDVVRESYRHVRSPMYAIPISVPKSLFGSNERDWSAARRNLLWLGSGGMIHKGLDLVLEAFAGNAEFNLHVVGPVDREGDFARAFTRELNSPNVSYYGFQDIAGERFCSIVAGCGFILYPSCSEGTPGSVLTAMAKGLIPIVSRESGLDVRLHGRVLDDCSIGTIRTAVRCLAAESASNLARRSAQSQEYVRSRHSRECFTSMMMNALSSAIAGEPGNARAVSPVFATTSLLQR